MRLYASLSSDPGAWLRNFGSKAVKGKFDSVGKSLRNAEAKVASAKKKVDELSGKIAARKREVEREKRQAEAKIKAAKDKVDHLQSKIVAVQHSIDNDKSHIHGCNFKKRVCVFEKPHFSCAHHVFGHCVWWHVHWTCIYANLPDIPRDIKCEANNFKYGIKLEADRFEKKGLIWAKEAADWALDQAKRGVEIVPTDLDPEVLALEGEKKGADWALELAQDGLKVADKLVDVTEKSLSVFKHAPNLFALKQSSIKGDLKKALHGEPVLLDMHAEIMGHDLEQRLAFSLTNQKFNAEQMGMIALGIATETFVKLAEDAKIIPHHFIHQIHQIYVNEKRHIDGIISRAENSNNVHGKPNAEVGAHVYAMLDNKKQEANSQHSGNMLQWQKEQQAKYDAYCKTNSNDPRSKRPMFDPCFYLQNNPDLSKAFGKDFNKAAGHWLEHGIKEGRQGSRQFDLASYLLRYPDLMAIFIHNGKVDFAAAMHHWQHHGRNEGRNPYPYACPENGGLKGFENAVFDPCYYLNSNQDLKKAFGGSNISKALKHWEELGIKQGRRSSAGFSIPDYIIRYLELRHIFISQNGDVNYSAALQHWYQFGHKQKRNPRPFVCVNGMSPELKNAEFDPCYYLSNNADLKKAFGDTNHAKALNHWEKHGIGEGRPSSASLDLSAYLLRYPDLQKNFLVRPNITYLQMAGYNKQGKQAMVKIPVRSKGSIDYKGAYKHWKEHGKKEGRNAKPFSNCNNPMGTPERRGMDFDPCYYVQHNEAIMGMNRGGAILHWLNHGKLEGFHGSASVDMQSYISRYPDLINTFIRDHKVNYEAALNHWHQFGKKEGRNPRPLQCNGPHGGSRELENAIFDPCFYLNHYPDLKQAFGTSFGKAAKHWVQFGRTEGRQGSAGFSVRDYVLRYDDLRNTFIRKLNDKEKVKNASSMLTKMMQHNLPKDSQRTGLMIDYAEAFKHWHEFGKKAGLDPRPIQCSNSGGNAEISKHVLDVCFYLNTNPDLKQSFGSDLLSAAFHWKNFGMHEDRQSSEHFSLGSYITRYPDMIHLFVKKDRIDYEGALAHWYQHGRREGRNAGPILCNGPAGSSRELANAVFDPCFYLNNNLDLKRKFGKKFAHAAQHWIQQGQTEGRQSSAGFSIRDYVLRYDDLRNTFIRRQPLPGRGGFPLRIDYNQAYQHWYQFGKKSGLNPRPILCRGGGSPELANKVLDVCFYLGHYPDLKRNYGNDFLLAAFHWKQSGISEGRQSSENFSIKSYVNRYGDLKRSFTRLGRIDYASALNHWYQSGRKEGRNPRP